MSRRLPGNWFVRRITLVLVMVSSPCGMMAAGAPLYAQPTGSYEFDIPSQPLDQALKAFSATTDLLLSYEAGMTAGRTSSAIAGRYTPEEALRRLLADTGLDYRFANDKTVTLRPAAGPLASPHASPQSHAPASDGSLTVPADQKPVKVPEVLIKEVHYRDDEKTYVAEEANTATRTDTPIKDVPQSIQVITRKVIEEQRTFRLTDALANVSGINPQQSTLQLFDSVLIRGFPASPQNFFRNGLFDPTARFVASDVANIQRLEVLKGPASVLYGQGDPGGIINLVTRKGLPDPYYAGNVTLGNFDFYRSEIDATGPLNAGKTVMYRLNVAGQKAGSFMDFVRRDLAFVAPTITWLVSPRTTFTVEGDYTQRWYNNARGVPAEGSLLPNIHGELPRSTFLGSAISTRTIAALIGLATI